MENTSKLPKVSTRDRFYYQRRNQNRIYEALTAFFAEEAEQRGISKKDVAEVLGCDASLITRLLNEPSNVTSDRISDFLLSLGAEMDYQVVRFKDRARPNYVHPLIQEGLKTDHSIKFGIDVVSSSKFATLKNSPSSDGSTKSNAPNYGYLKSDKVRV